MNICKKKPRYNEWKFNARRSNPPLEIENKKTVRYGSESKAEGIMNILVKGADSIKVNAEQCVMMLMKDFK